MSEKKADHEMESKPESTVIPVPELDYKPSKPKSYRPKIALIGCGGITQSHLKNWTAEGYEIVALCDLDQSKAVERQKEYAPNARIYTDYHEMLKKEDSVDVIDAALHPGPRAAAIEASLQAGKNVLSQKPFVLDLDTGEKLAALAEEKNVKLAVNQNGRWAPYVRWMYQAIKTGVIGEPQSLTVCINWDHSWCKGSDFERIHHLVLYDFGVHWMDMTTLYFETQTAQMCSADIAYTRQQSMKCPMLASARILFDNGMATLTFDGNSEYGVNEAFNLTGSEGTIRAYGPICSAQNLTLYTAKGYCHPQLEGSWFEEGFRGAMGELLCAIEEDREPENSARNNLRTLQNVFAVLASADSGQPVKPGAARQLGDSCKII